MSKKKRKKRYNQILNIIVNNIYNSNEVQKDAGQKVVQDVELTYDLSQFEVKNFGDFYDFADLLMGLFLYDFYDESATFILGTLSKILKENPLIEVEMVEWFEGDHPRSRFPMIYETIEDVIYFVGIKSFKNQQLLLRCLSSDLL